MTLWTRLYDDKRPLLGETCAVVKKGKRLNTADPPFVIQRMLLVILRLHCQAEPVGLWLRKGPEQSEEG